MKTSLRILTSLTGLLTLTYAYPVLSQSITPANDGTGTQVNINGNQFDITGGSYSGNHQNLFHSFEAFGLDSGQIANFLTNPDVQNVLSRIVGGNASVINGLIQLTGSNANLFLMNPAGIIFGNGASLNVPADFTATTATGIGFNGGWFGVIGTPEYSQLVGNPTGFVFNNGESGIIVNAGHLGVNAGQQLSLYGGTVINTGTLSAPGGNITVTAIENGKWLKLTPQGSLLSVEIPIQQDAQGNLLNITAASLPELLTLVPSGVGVEINAQGDPVLSQTNTLIPSDAGTAIVSGNINTASALGGEITITGDKVGIIGANLDASGVNGGGTVLIGGDYQGNGTIPNAEITLVDNNSVIAADALNGGEGGRIIVWSEGITGFYGDITAKGGISGGDGGFVEVSGKESLIFQGQVDLSAIKGELGTLLLDPQNITISVTSSNPIEVDASLPEILNGEFAGQDITISNQVLENQTGNIILQATNNITLENGLSLNFVSGGDITFTADAGTPDGVGNFSMDATQFINTNGRNLTISGANIILGEINTSSFISNGGSVSITATGNITSGLIETVSFSTGSVGNGGKVDISATGNITTGLIDTRSDTGNGGDVTIESIAGNIDLASNLDNVEFTVDSASDLGNGGKVQVVAQGNITTGGIHTSATEEGDTGGDIYLESKGGSIDIALNSIVGEVSVYTGGSPANAGVIEIIAQDNITVDKIISARSSVGNGGFIQIESLTGIINLSQAALFSGGGTISGNGNGADINIIAQGDVTLPTGISIDTRTGSSSLGNSGSIAIESANGAIIPSGGTLNLDTSSTLGNAGNITLTSFNDLTVAVLNASGGVNSGNLTLNSSEGIVINNTLTGNSLTTNAGTNTQINTDINISTQTYNNPVILGNSVTLSGNTLSLAQGLNGNNNNFTINFSNSATLSNLTNLNNFISNGVGGTNLTGNLTTSGSQTYNNAVTLTGEATLSGTSLSLSQPLNAANNNLTLAFSSPLTVSNSNLTNLNNFTIGGNGSTNLTGDLTAQGTITLNSPVTITQNSTIQSTTGGLIINAPVTPQNNVSITLNASQDITTNSISGNGVTLNSFQGSINTTLGTLDSNGGDINLTSANNLSTGNLDSTGDIGIAGTINLTATNNITTGQILAGSNLDNTGGVGGNNITLNAGGNIITVGGIVSGSSTSQAGGNITLTSTGGSIDTRQAGIVSGSLLGNGGNVNITAKGDLQTAQIFTISLGGSIGGNINLTSQEGLINTSTVLPFSPLTILGQTINLEGLATWSSIGQGGTVNLIGNNNITTGLIHTGNSLNSGNITIESKAGLIDTSSSSLNTSSTLGNAGNITLTSFNDLTVAVLNASGGVNSGNLTLNSSEGIVINNTLTGNSLTTNAGTNTQINTDINISTQTYNNPVILGNSVTLSGNTLSLAQGLNGNNNNLVLAFISPITVSGDNFTNIQNFTSSGIGGTNLTKNFTTSGSQTYNNAVTLTGETTLTGTSLSLSQPLNAANNNLTLAFSNNVTVANFNNLADFTINGNGETKLTGDLTAQGTITLNAPVTITQNTTIQSIGEGLVINAPLTTQNNSSITLNANQNLTTQSITTKGGNITLTAGNDIKTSSLNSESELEGNGGNISLNAGGNINTSFPSDGSKVPFISAGSENANGGDIIIKAGGDIQTNSIVTFTNGNSSKRAGNITLESMNGSINTTFPFVINGKSFTVGLLGSGSLNGTAGNITLTAPGNITTGAIITGSTTGTGGNVTINSTNGSINTLTGAITDSSLLNQLNSDLASLVPSISSGLGILSFSTGGNGGNITITSPQDIITSNLFTIGANGGNVEVISDQGQINTGIVNTSGLNNNGGDVTLNATQDIKVTYINAQGGIGSSNNSYTPPGEGSSNSSTSSSGVGGNVNITSQKFVRATGTFIDQNGINASISSAGGVEGGNITIRHGGEGVTPFIVGDASVNGSAGQLTSGVFDIDQGTFFNTEIRGNVAIISVSLPNVNQDFEGRIDSPLEVATASATSIQITTLTQVREILAYIAESSQEKPALVYVRFVPPTINPQISLASRGEQKPIQTSQEVTDEQLTAIESELTGEYSKFLNVESQGSVLTQDTPDDYELEVLLITEDQKPLLIQLPGVTREEVEIQAKALYTSIQDPRSDSYKPFASQLYQWLIAPLEAELQARKVENVLFFMPAGLRILPLSALYQEETGEFVAQKPYAVGFAPSINLLDYRYTNLNNASILAFGASQFAPDQNQTPLPAVETEVQVITDDKDQKYLNQDFNLTTFQQERQTNPFPIVHLATHADFLESDPSQSYIQLYDEKLTLPQWRELNLRNPVADLLVISACKTAYGNPEIELGFGGMAVQTGVKTVVASLWEVGDVGTLALMTKFYRALQDSPTKARALQQAQQAMINGDIRQIEGNLAIGDEKIPLPGDSGQEVENLSHPFFWAPFTVIGSPW